MKSVREDACIAKLNHAGEFFDEFVRKDSGRKVFVLLRYSTKLVDELKKTCGKDAI